ncbi:hypothetical protein ACFLSQ_11880, partial [Bacteroidota bacterium]
KAWGVCAGDDGMLDLTSQSSFSPGEYYVNASLNIADVGYEDYDAQKINFSLANDVALFVYKPKASHEKKYPLGKIPIQLEVVNFGINAIGDFELFCSIYFDGVLKDSSYRTWSPDDVGDSLMPTKSEVVSMDDFYPDVVGNYEIRAMVHLLDQTDQDLASNIIARAGYPAYEFAISKEIDLHAVKIIAPTSEYDLTVGRPMFPIARYTNQGVNDLDFDSVFFWITYTPTSEVVFRDTIVNSVISAGARFDTTDVQAEKQFAAPYAGTYQICSKIVSPYCNNPPSWKETCTTFSVDAGMRGDFTVGSGQDYETIQAAVDDIYMKGVDGHIRFLLTDRSYTIGNIMMPDGPALDLSSYIPGLGADATVSFMPSEDRAVERGSSNSGVTINVETGSGMGILMGQNLYPTNGAAIVLGALPSQKSKYANSAGHFTFDGGQNKSFRFVLKTPTDNEVYAHNVFYLQQGSSNNAIKNCIFENNYTDDMGNPLTPHVFIPKVKTTGSEVVFMDNEWNDMTGFSSAIVLISRAPMDIEKANMLYGLDSLTASNNEISGNEISGFGYGVVDRGAGALLRTGHDEWVKYYNHNNIISNNIIHNVSRAGIFLGFTTDDQVTGNRIYNVDGLGAYTFGEDDDAMMGKSDKSQEVIPAIPDAGGIIAGGDSWESWYGFNNINLTISGNEISAVESDFVAYGIKVEQSQTKYQHAPMSYFPDAAENSRVMNNIIWGIETNDDVSRVGI